MNQHLWDKRHDEWKTGNYGQDRYDGPEEEEDEEDVDFDWDEEIEGNFLELETERAR